MKTDNDFLKGSHGTLDDKIIVTSYNGETYLRRKPKSIRMAAGMVEQGERISAVAALWKAMKAVGLERAWQIAAEGCGLTAYNMVVKHCQSAFDGQGIISDFEKLKLTIGKLQLPDHLTMANNETGRIEVTWNANSNTYPQAHESDLFVIACMKKANNFALRIPNIGIFRRKNGHAFISPEILPADFPNLFCFFRSEDGKAYSESKFLLSK